MKGCVPAAALLFLSASATFASVDKIYDGKTRSILNNRRATPVTHEEVTINDDYEWLRLSTHSFVADISRESPSNDDPDFVDQLLQTSVATDGTRLTQSPTFKPSNQLGTSVSPTSFPLHSTMPTQQVSSIPTSDEVTIGSNSTQLSDEVVPTQSPTIMNVPVSSSKGPTSSSPLTATRTTTGIPTTRLTSPSSSHDLGPSQHHQYHAHEASSNNTNEAIGDNDDVIQVDLPQIICDITTFPNFYQNLERKHVLLATMTNMMYDLLDTHLPKLVYDLQNISLRVEVKKNKSDNLVPTVRLHAYFRGATFFSSRASPTRDDLITLLLRFFDVDEFSRRLMLPFRTRGVNSTDDELVEVNSCYFTLEDGSLIEPGFEYEEKTLPNTGTLTGLGMQVVLLLSALIVIACFLTVATFLWSNNYEDDIISCTSSDMDQLSIAKPLANSANVGAIKREEVDNDIPSPEDTFYTPMQSPPPYTLRSGLSSLSESPCTVATRSSDGHDPPDFGLFKTEPSDDEMSRFAAEASRWEIYTDSATMESV